LAFLSLNLDLEKNPIRTYKAGLIGSISSLLIVSSKILARDPRNQNHFLAISLTSLQNYTAILLSIIQALFPRRPALFTPDGKAVDLESSTSALSRYSMHWCTTALALAGNSVTVEKLPVIDYLTRSKSQPLLVLASSKDTLWNLILAERYLGFVKQWTIMLARSVVTFGSPYCVMRLLRSLEDNHGRTDDAWIWLLGVGVFSVCQTVINHHLTWIQWSEMAIPVRAQLMIAIFQKGLRRKDSKEQKKSSDSKNSEKPEVVSLISPEAASFSKFTAVNYMIPASFVRFAFAVLFLSKLLGWQSTLVGMMATLLCVPIHTILIKEQRVAWKRLMAVHNRKMKVVTEALHSLRQIKFSALEKQWEEHIEGFRGEEIKDLRWMATANSIKWTWGVAAPFIVATASICTFAYLEGAITPSIIFPLIKVLPHLQETLGSVPDIFQDYFTARINSKRMDEFLRRPEQKKFLGPSPSGVVIFQDASIAWPSDEVEGESTQEKQDNSPHRFSLHGIDLQFPVGELSVISGKTGSGKSLLLAAIIGEVELLGGRINAPSMAEGHPVAFVSQTPWLQNATIKDNILFGNEFEKERYEKVLIACALQPDLAALAKGDETQIGLRGVKLSGGQRARLAFGRALYSRAELLVLDDIFSALDSHVSKEIFNALTGELSRGRTRILVTHHVSLCLAEAKYMVHIQDNSIGYAGNPDSLGKEVQALEKEVHSTPDPSVTEKLTTEASDKASDKISPAKKLRPSSSRTDFKVYKTYFAAAGGLGFTIIYLLGLIVKQLLNALTTWLLGRINSSHQEKLVDQPDNKILVLAGKSGSGLQKYLSPYLWSSLLAVVLEYLFHLHASSGSIRASEILFRQMTARVIRMPILWLDTTPIGEMLRLYTLDMRYVDYHVLESLSEFADFLVTVLTIIGVGYAFPF
jgi:ABC-type multidrug transport system fused ATPase/permease subunit